MAQPTLRQLVKDLLKSMNEQLHAATKRLEPYSNNSDVKSLTETLRQQTRQAGYAASLFNDKDTDGAIKAMPKPEVVQYYCDQADQVLAAYQEGVTVGDSDSFIKQSKAKSTTRSKPARPRRASDDQADKVEAKDEDSTPESSDETETIPKPRPTSARSMRQPSPAPAENKVDDIEAEFKELSLKKATSGLEPGEYRRYRELRKQLNGSDGLMSRVKSFLDQHKLTEENIQRDEQSRANEGR